MSVQKDWARDPEHFSSRSVSVIPPPDDTEASLLPAGLPPIQADPPVHTWTAGSGPWAASRAGGLPVKASVDTDKCQGHGT